MAVSNSNVTKRKEGEESGNYMVLFVYKIPKRNHEAMVQLEKQANEMFKRVGVLRSEVFHLSSTENMMGFINIAQMASASQDEVLLEIHTYRDRQHLAEVGDIMEKDKSAGMLYQQFMGLITPGSCIFGEFGRINL